MRRDENLESMRLRGLEDALHVLDSIVFLKTFADQGPRESFFTQDLVLRIDEYNCRVLPLNFHGYLRSSFQVAETGLKAGPVSLITDQCASFHPRACCTSPPQLTLKLA